MKLWPCLCLFLAACFQDSTPQHSTFLPLDYKSTFQTVRACRQVTAHNNNYQRVLANAVAADAYTTASYPLPAGSVVVAEQHQDSSCNSLIGFDLMAKEQPGYDTANHDWHWQVLDDNERVSQDGHLQTCISCHAQTTCNDDLCSPP
jgi:hypothetical protein